MELLGLLWNEAIIRPLINSLIVLYLVLFNNLGLSIVILTILINILTLPLTLKSIRQTRALSAVGPRMQEIREKYKNDRQRQSQETMRMYREQGINPVGCLGPFVVQMPILLGLYWAMIKILPSAPERLADLSGLLYSWIPAANTVLPLNSGFLGIDLALFGSDHGLVGYVIMVLVGVSMWVSMKLTTPSTSATGTQAQTQKMMQYMFPVMIGFLSLNFPTGLSLYWIASSFVRAGIQMAVPGQKSSQPAGTRSNEQAVSVSPKKETSEDESSGSDSSDRGRSHRNS